MSQPSESSAQPDGESNNQSKQSKQFKQSKQSSKKRANLLQPVLNAGDTALKAGQKAGQAAVETTGHVGKAVAGTAGQVGKAIGTGAAEVFGRTTHGAGQVSEAIGEGAVEVLDRATHGAGQALTFIGGNPLLNNRVVRKLASVFKLDWLMGMTNQVDVVKAQTQVKELQQRYPEDTPREIAHRIMVQKAFYAGSMGFASSILPGVAAALLAIDLAATTALQTEMLYQIAAAYGLDLKDPARKGEVLAIFGLALGGSNAIKAGLGVLRNVPFAGMLIGASTNATMLYSLGYAACRFYESKLEAETEEPASEALQTIRQESEQYLERAIAQQTVMDQILAHMIAASYPETRWEDLLPELEALQFDQDSLQTIAQNIKSLQPLETLLEQLNCDFAVPLLAQCRRIAESHEGISDAERQVIEAVKNHCHTYLEQVISG